MGGGKVGNVQEQGIRAKLGHVSDILHQTGHHT